MSRIRWGKRSKRPSIELTPRRERKRKEERAHWRPERRRAKNRIPEGAKGMQVKQANDCDLNNYSPARSSGDTHLRGLRKAGWNAPDSKRRSKGITSLFTPVVPSAGTSRPGSQCTLSRLPLCKDCWISRMRRIKYFAAAIFSFFRRVGTLPQSSIPTLPGEMSSAQLREPPSS